MESFGFDVSQSISFTASTCIMYIWLMFKTYVHFYRSPFRILIVPFQLLKLISLVTIECKSQGGTLIILERNIPPHFNLLAGWWCFGPMVRLKWEVCQDRSYKIIPATCNLLALNFWSDNKLSIMCELQIGQRFHLCISKVIHAWNVDFESESE